MKRIGRRGNGKEHNDKSFPTPHQVMEERDSGAALLHHGTRVDGQHEQAGT